MTLNEARAKSQKASAGVVKVLADVREQHDVNHYWYVVSASFIALYHALLVAHAIAVAHSDVVDEDIEFADLIKFASTPGIGCSSQVVTDFLRINDLLNEGVQSLYSEQIIDAVERVTNEATRICNQYGKASGTSTVRVEQPSGAGDSQRECHDEVRLVKSVQSATLLIDKAKREGRFSRNAIVAGLETVIDTVRGIREVMQPVCMERSPFRERVAPALLRGSEVIGGISVCADTLREIINLDLHGAEFILGCERVILKMSGEMLRHGIDSKALPQVFVGDSETELFSGWSAGGAPVFSSTLPPYRALSPASISSLKQLIDAGMEFEKEGSLVPQAVGLGRMQLS